MGYISKRQQPDQRAEKQPKTTNGSSTRPHNITQMLPSNPEIKEYMKYVL